MDLIYHCFTKLLGHESQLWLKAQTLGVRSTQQAPAPVPGHPEVGIQNSEDSRQTHADEQALPKVKHSALIWAWNLCVRWALHLPEDILLSVGGSQILQILQRFWNKERSCVVQCYSLDAHSVPSIFTPCLCAALIHPEGGTVTR